MIQVGDVFKTNNSGYCEVIEYIRNNKVKIKWLDSIGYEMYTYSSALQSGAVKNPYQPSVCGVGYIGVGDFPVYIDGIRTLEHKTWSEMIVRCYSEKSLRKRPTYENKEVCEEWKNFQNFSRWCQNAVGFGNDSWVLDKDIVVKNNLIYSPHACAFIPKELNNRFTTSKATRGAYPMGVSWDKSKNRFVAYGSFENGFKKLGTFTDPSDAFVVYKERKESYIRSLADIYKDIIDERVVSALRNYVVTEED